MHWHQLDGASWTFDLFYSQVSTLSPRCMEVIWGHNLVCYRRTPGSLCVKWQWVLLFWWHIFNFGKYLEKSWGISPMSQVFREATERKKKKNCLGNVMVWCHCPVRWIFGHCYTCCSKVSTPQPKHCNFSTVVLSDIGLPDLQWLIETVFFRNRKNSKHPTGHDPCFSMTIPTHKGKMKSLEETSAATRNLTSTAKESFPAPRKGWEYHLFPWVHSNSC